MIIIMMAGCGNQGSVIALHLHKRTFDLSLINWEWIGAYIYEYKINIYTRIYNNNE